ncbi:MAG TPA: GGDEF domain-containing protein [Jatrophihabitans sp.]|nr:GGDEF domain-containing protein [Jatrophihabitans sp.]
MLTDPDVLPDLPQHHDDGSWWRSRLRWLSDWLPEGRSIPADIWARRHRAITRFALLQAIGLGLFGLVRGFAVPTCLVDALLVGAPAVLAHVSWASRRLRTASATVSLMFASAMLVDLAGGSTEAHFHFFVMVGVVAAYQDWMAFGICILITVVHHAVMGVLEPRAVYGNPAAWHKPVLWALIHGLFVLGASLTHIFAWKTNEQQVLSDPLTGLRNRTGFLEGLARRLADKAIPVSVLFLDIDDFKSINDVCGHHAGDEALRQTGVRIAAAVRDCDLVARLAGDEFAVIVRGPAAVAEEVGLRILAQLRKPITVHGREVFVQTSIGVADDALAGSRDPSDLLRDADVAMYLAKSSGKNQLITYTAGVDQAVLDRAELAGEVRRVLSENQSRCTTSRSWTVAPAGSPASRRCCAGIIRFAA